MAQNNPTYAQGALRQAPIFDILTRKREGHVIDWNFAEHSYSTSNPSPAQFSTTIGSSCTVTAAAAGRGGVLLTGAASGVGAQINSFGYVAPAVAAGVEQYFEVVCAIDNLTAASGSVFLGLQDTAGDGSTTPTYALTATAGLTGTTDLIGIAIAAAGTVTLVSQEGSATDPTAISMGTMAAATDVTMGFVIRGNNYVEAWYNGVLKGTWTSSTGLPNEPMVIDLNSQGGASTFKIATVKRCTYVCAY